MLSFFHIILSQFYKNQVQFILHIWRSYRYQKNGWFNGQEIFVLYVIQIYLIYIDATFVVRFSYTCKRKKCYKCTNIFEVFYNIKI